MNTNTGSEQIAPTPRIAIITGSTRPRRHGEAIAAWVFDIAVKREDADFELLDLAEIDLPLLDEPVPPIVGSYSQEHTVAWSERITPFDGYVFVVPEYNHGPSAAVKNAIDFLYAEWNNKAAGFVGYGAEGGIRAVEQLRLTMGELQVADVRAAVSVSMYTDFVEFTTFAPRPHQEEAVTDMLDQLTAWSRALRPLRSNDDETETR